MKETCKKSLASVKLIFDSWLEHAGSYDEWNDVLYASCRNKDQEIVKFINEKWEAYIRTYKVSSDLDWDSGLVLACKFGNFEVVKYLVEVKKEKVEHLTTALITALAYKHSDTVQLLEKHGAAELL